MKLAKPKNTLQKRFIAVESDSLVIETIQIVEKQVGKQGLSPKGTVPGTHLRILKLKGTWRANEYNELVFEAAARKGPPEKYTFKGAWKINNNQQIEYSCGDDPDVLTFKGHWDIASVNKLVYLFEGSSTSRFEFKVQLESPIIYPKKGEIRYRIGVGMRQSRLSAPGQVLILYGEWKFGRNLGLNFQMDYGQGKVRAIEFGAEVFFGHNKVILALKNEFGDSLGITLTMSHKFLEHFDAEAFIRLKSRQKERSEQAIEAGITIPF
ncbi:MAG: hypothetical protein KJ710_07900 [Candidatus Omnitrophica bacterium]|nr:hypothetical protein [Candidatus Omnitrophota bacterium]MBU1924158.1 hypothetical protein [Candidatus Omnitrophota bacterium]